MGHGRQHLHRHARPLALAKWLVKKEPTATAGTPLYDADCIMCRPRCARGDYSLHTTQVQTHVNTHAHSETRDLAHVDTHVHTHGCSWRTPCAGIMWGHHSLSPPTRIRPFRRLWAATKWGPNIFQPVGVCTQRTAVTDYPHGTTGGRILNDFSAHADGNCRGLVQVGGWHRTGLDATRP